MTNDEQQLNLLSVFHYVVGGLSAMCSCFPSVHLAIGIAMVCGAFEGHGKHDPLDRVFGWFFVVFPAMMILAGWTFSICIIVAGRKLALRRAWTYCVVIAGMECLMMPFGTVLGIFTIILLTKESVKKLFFANNEDSPPAPTG